MITVVSFGYGHGTPSEAHITLDLRQHFRDPHVSPKMRHLTARDLIVRDAVLATPGIRELAGAIILSGVTHYAADRRIPNGLLHKLAKATGKGRFYQLADHGMNGAYCLDQSWHHAWETIAAAVVALSSPDDTRRSAPVVSTRA